MPCGTLERLTVCPVAFRLASDLKENSLMVREPTFPTSRYLLIGSNVIRRGLLPAVAAVNVPSEPSVPTGNITTFPAVLLATYKCVAFESRIAVTGAVDVVLVAEVEKGDPGITVRVIWFEPPEYWIE